jgi:nucleotide-binding universal stress UspA family protein
MPGPNQTPGASGAVAVTRLLVPIDDSRASASAIELAAWIAERTRQETTPPPTVQIDLLHVVNVAEPTGQWLADLGGLFGREPRVVSEAYATLARQRGARILDDAVARCREAGAIATGHLEVGNVVDSISRRGADADLLILGLRGESGERFAREAGRTEMVVARAPISTLVIPAGLERIEGIALGYDQSDGSHEALAMAVRLATALMVPIQAFAVGLPDVDFAAARKLVPPGVAFTSHHFTGDPHEVLPAQAVRHRCNVLALGYRGRSRLKDTLLGRTTEWLIGNVDLGILAAR